MLSQPNPESQHEHVAPPTPTIERSSPAVRHLVAGMTTDRHRCVLECIDPGGMLVTASVSHLGTQPASTPADTPVVPARGLTARWTVRHADSERVISQVTLDLPLALSHAEVTAAPALIFGEARYHASGHFGIQLFLGVAASAANAALAAHGRSVEDYPSMLWRVEDICIIAGSLLLAQRATPIAGDDLADASVAALSRHLGGIAVRARPWSQRRE